MMCMTSKGTGVLTALLALTLASACSSGDDPPPAGDAGSGEATIDAAGGSPGAGGTGGSPGAPAEAGAEPDAADAAVPCEIVVQLDGGVPSGGALDLAGRTLADEWGGVFSFEEAAYRSESGDEYLVSRVDNGEGWAVVQNGCDNAFNAGLWSLVEWHEDGDVVWWCMTAFDAESEAAALAADRADRSDPESGGCGGFPWSALRAPGEGGAADGGLDSGSMEGGADGGADGGLDSGVAEGGTEGGTDRG